MGLSGRITTRAFQAQDRFNLESVVEPCYLKEDDEMEASPSYTIIDKESKKPLACGGVIIENNAGRCWLNLSKEAVDSYKLSVCQYIALHGAQIVSQYKLESLFAFVLPEFEEGQKLLERFGFVCEGFIDDKLFYRKYSRSWVSFQD